MPIPDFLTRKFNMVFNEIIIIFVFHKRIRGIYYKSGVTINLFCLKLIENFQSRDSPGYIGKGRLWETASYFLLYLHLLAVFHSIAYEHTIISPFLRPPPLPPLPTPPSSDPALVFVGTIPHLP